MLVRLTSIIFLLLSVNASFATENIPFSYETDFAEECEELKSIVQAMNGLDMEAQLTCEVSGKSYLFLGSRTAKGRIVIKKPENSCVEGLPAVFYKSTRETEGDRSLSELLQPTGWKSYQQGIYFDVCTPQSVKPYERLKATSTEDAQGRLYFYGREPVNLLGDDNDASLGYNSLDLASKSRKNRSSVLAEAVWLTHLSHSLLKRPNIKTYFNGLYTQGYNDYESAVVLTGKQSDSVVRFFTIRDNDSVTPYKDEIQDLIEQGVVLTFPKASATLVNEKAIQEGQKCRVEPQDLQGLVLWPEDQWTESTIRFKYERPNTPHPEMELQSSEAEVTAQILETNSIQSKIRLTRTIPVNYYPLNQNDELDVVQTIDVSTQLATWGPQNNLYKCNLDIRYSEGSISKPADFMFKKIGPSPLYNNTAISDRDKYIEYNDYLQKQLDAIQSVLNQRFQ